MNHPSVPSVNKQTLPNPGFAYPRACVIVLDSVGIGALPDAADYGDTGANTLGNIYKTRGRLTIPHLLALGLGNIEGSGLPDIGEFTEASRSGREERGIKIPAHITGAYGRMAELTRAKDTTSGHWELAGLIMDEPFRTFPEGFPEDLLRQWLKNAGRPELWLGNETASGTEIIKRLGAAHMRTGAPIVYTSADSVFQIAAHEDVIPLYDLYALCAEARALLTGEWNVGRVIARPFAGTNDNFTRTEHRKDYAVPPPKDTILDGLEQRGLTVMGIGKIEDIFCRRGVTHINHTTNNHDGIEATVDALINDATDSFIFVNLVDFDMKYGHRNDAEGYARALEYFDTQLPRIMASLRENDILFITADHGCDPTDPSTDHSREYVPVLAYGGGVRPTDLGTRETFADLGATVYEYLTGSAWGTGKSFLTQILQ
jgi:phosphopentomutase